MQRLALLTLLGLAAGSTAAAAQTTSTITLNGRKIVTSGSLSPAAMESLMALGYAGEGEVVSMTPESGDDETDETEETPVDPQYFQLFQQAMFDRRPSTILAEWSKPEPLASGEDPELADPADPEPIADEPKAPEAPVEPAKPETLVEPTAPEDLIQDVASLADVVALAEARDAARADYAEQKKVYDEGLAAFEAQVAAYQAALPEYEGLKAAYDEEKKAWDKLKKTFDKAKAKVEAEKAANKMKRTQRDIEIVRRNVSLGRWELVGEALVGLGKANAKAQYPVLLGKISRSPQPMNGQLAQYQEEPAFEFDDIVELIKIAPEGFDSKQANLMAPLVRRVFAQGHSLDDWLTRLRTEVERPEEERVIDRRLAALLLTAQGSNKELGEFLPTIEEAVADDDRQGLNLIARHRLAEHREEMKPELIGEAWEATLAALAPGEVEDDEKKEALKRAVDLASRVRDAKGDAWLRETFTERPERGMEILAVIGAEASQGMVQRAYQPDDRLEDMKLLRSAVDALLEIAPERAEDWRETLTLVADTWLREAAHSFEYSQQDSMGMRSSRDSYGNVYWYDYSYNYNRVPVKPVEPEDLLETRPDGPWRNALPASLRPKIDQTIAELYLKVSEETLAYPYIKDLAASDPKKANDLAKTFIEVWLKNNDPNSSRSRTNIYSYSFGYSVRASGIPLTRSKQDRNLKDLSHWISKLREIEGLELDSDLLVQAFTQSHSEAEIYRVEIMEAVFGDLETLEPKTLASMTQRMRGNLATIWRQPDVQRANKTNRKQKDIEAEVERGYEIAQQLLARALEAHPGAWELELSRAALLHDLNNFKNDLQKSSDFAAQRKEALELFELAAQHYVAAIPELKTNEYSVAPFESWFFATLGASDLAAVTQNTLLAQHEVPKIKAALESIEGEPGEKHLGMFANLLFTRLSGANPAIKNRYLVAGFDIVGDHPQAREARKVYDYYKDLVTEIEFLATVDGGSDVGQEPFGVMIDLRYTKEIGRESGGFAKYLQNQANAVNAYYNYGRPQENYRDKFEESVRTALTEQFDVMSITFNREKAASKADAEFGWRRTSYAYLLLKAKGPEIDRIPPLKIDLDFNDVTGYVVLPISSPVVAIDASTESDPRPYENVQITQTLDERRADEGILVMEVKAQADGLVPNLDTLVNVDPADFEVTKIEDEGVSVARFADNEDGVISERIWLMEMRAKEGIVDPEKFRFAEPAEASIQSLYQRYDDADLVTAELEVSLEQKYANAEGFDWRWLLLIPVVLLLGLMLRSILKGSGDVAGPAGPQMPEEMTPFSVLNLLRDVRSSPRIDDGQRRELDAAVIQIEQHFFGEADAARPDLVSIAQTWIKRAH